MSYHYDYLITENGIYEFTVEDVAGNITKESIEVTNINKIPPVITVGNYTDTLTNQDVTVELFLDKGWFEPSEGVKITNNGMRASYTFTENGEKLFVARDAWGNISKKLIVIDNINKIPPVITIAPYPTELTDQDITVYATVDKGYLNAYSYTFTENGSFTFIAVDAWVINLRRLLL